LSLRGRPGSVIYYHWDSRHQLSFSTLQIIPSIHLRNDNFSTLGYAAVKQLPVKVNKPESGLIGVSGGIL
jgi:hypothetical protein